MRGGIAWGSFPLSPGGDRLYAQSGANPSNPRAFQYFDISDNRWYPLANTPDAIGADSGGACCFTPLSGYERVYSLQGDNRLNYFVHSGAHGTWTQTMNQTGTWSHGEGCAVTYGGTCMLPNGTPGALLYATKGRENKSFWRYAFSTTPTLAPAVPVGWTSLGDMDVVATKHSALTYDTAASTHGSRVYALYGDNYARFRGYNPTQGTWEGLSLPWNNTGDGVSLAARTIAGASDLIYALRGAHQDDFRVYDISENGWDRRSNFPWDVGAGGCMAYCPSDARLYALRGWGYNHFASYQTIGDDGGGPQGVPGNASTGSCLTVNALGGNRYRFVCQGLNGQRATYRIVGADGRVVWSVVSADGRAEWVANRTSTPAGVYAVLVDAGDTRASAQVSIVR